jgi:hypothetical protein
VLGLPALELEVQQGDLSNILSPARGQVNAKGFDGKFMRQRRDWKRLLSWILLRVLGADGLSASFHFVRLGVPIQPVQ